MPNRNILIQFDQPLQRFDTKKLHLRLKKDSTYHDAPYALDTVPNNILAYRLRDRVATGTRISVGHRLSSHDQSVWPRQSRHRQQVLDC